MVRLSRRRLAFDMQIPPQSQQTKQEPLKGSTNPDLSDQCCESAQQQQRADG
jgi:hypothetical protein